MAAPCRHGILILPGDVLHLLYQKLPRGAAIAMATICKRWRRVFLPLLLAQYLRPRYLRLNEIQLWFNKPTRLTQILQQLRPNLTTCLPLLEFAVAHHAFCLLHAVVTVEPQPRAWRLFEVVAITDLTRLQKFLQRAPALLPQTFAYCTIAQLHELIGDETILHDRTTNGVMDMAIARGNTTLLLSRRLPHDN